MKCSRCEGKAVISSPALCKEHFMDYFEQKVKDNIERHGLIRQSDSVCVAASGGKDSTNALYLVKKLLNPKRLLALVVDEGIGGYRALTISDLKRFCEANKIELKIISFKEEFGVTLDEILASKKLRLKPCNICGTLRRYLLNRHSRGFDVVVTGHNLDDESQAVVMNLFRNQIGVLARLGPATGSPRKGFVQRVKPLYMCSERESLVYSLLIGFNPSFSSCPNIGESYRAAVRRMLNAYESRHKGTKLNIVRHFLSLLPGLKKMHAGLSPAVCSVCGEPSAGGVCNACRLVEKLRSI